MKAFLDACVLYPTVVREMLLGCAQKKLFEPLWSPRVLEEWSRAADKHGVGSIAGAEIALLSDRWPSSNVLPKPSDEARLVLPDPNDVHVLASAIAASADILVTVNAKDFPRHSLSEEGISRQDPDALLLAFYREDPKKMRDVVDRVHQTAAMDPTMTLTASGLIKKARLPRLAKALRTDL